MERFKKIYIEITNICNLNCKFCLPHNRKEKHMAIEEFEHILDSIKDYTKYVYLHVKGEPLFHPQIEEFINLAHNKGFFINITTNGTLIENINNTIDKVRQINISLHSTKDIEIVEKLKDVKNTFVSFRLWNSNKNNEKIIKEIEELFNVKIDLRKNTKLAENIFLSQEKEFIWPSLKNEINSEIGNCYGLKNHIGILVDGTVIPCCLDNNGDINLGNIFENSLEEILKNKKCIDMINGFKENRLVEELCTKCYFNKSVDIDVT